MDYNKLIQSIKIGVSEDDIKAESAHKNIQNRGMIIKICDNLDFIILFTWTERDNWKLESANDNKELIAIINSRKLSAYV